MELIQKREPAIDLMRFMGLVLIMIAHLSLPVDSVVFQIRTFDVPLMVFVSALSYSGRDTGPYLAFVWKRAKRILIPVYLFLTVFFLVHWACAALGWSAPIAPKKIWGSYLLHLKPSINFVWIFRVFLIVMFMTTPLAWLEKRLKGWLPAALVFASMVTAQHFLIGWLKPMKLGWFIDEWVLFALGYGSIFFLGLRIKKAGWKEGLFYVALISAAFIPLAFSVAQDKGSWLNMQAFKYPPGVYYVLWGTLCSCILWLTRRWWRPVLEWKPFLFIGQNTMWIYLWHIVFGYPYYRSTAVPYWLKFVLFLIVPSLIVLLQRFIVARLENGHPERRFLQYLKG